MADPMSIAQKRREDYKKDIAQKEAEIEELKELISDLDSFIEFGEALVNDGPVESKSEDKAEKPETSEAKPAETVQSQQPRIVKSRQPNGDWDDDDASGIARVLAARNA